MAVRKDKSNEIRIVRSYDAPVKVVWDAWTEMDQVAQWWGPRGFTITNHSKDLRAGGSWAYTMHGPDGVDYPNKTKYFEVEKHSRLVYDHGASDDKPAMFRVSVFFSEADGKTKMDMRMTLPTPEAAEQAKTFIKAAGGDGTWDRLAEYLAKTTAGKEKFVINRSFDTKIERMFEMWTDPLRLSQWAPPTGSKMTYMKSDIRVGSGTFYFMTNESGEKLFARNRYLEIAKPHRLVYTQQFCDEKEVVSRHPMAPTWPETMLTTVLLTDEGEGRTRVTLEWEPHGSATPEELATFAGARTGMAQGWTGSLDKLEAMLA